MKKLFYLSLVLLISACSSTDGTKQTSQKENTQSFESYKSSFIDSLWKVNPIWASYEGYHKYDSKLPIPNSARMSQVMEFVDQQMNQLMTYDLESLSDADKINYYLIRDYLKSQEFEYKEFKSGIWNPSVYNLGGAFFQVLNYRGSSLEDRLEDLSKKLELVPSYYKEAQNNINKPSKVHTMLALEQLEGSKSVFSTSLLDSLKKSSHDSTFKQMFTNKANDAVEAIDGYLSFLKNQIVPSLDSNSRSFRIGKELFEQKFAYQIQSTYSAEEIFKAAVEEKSKIHDHMFRLSEMLWEKYLGSQEKPDSKFDQINMVINEIAKNHVHRDSFITAIQKQIPMLEAFVVDNDLITLDPEKPLVVRATPKYMRGVAGASISAPGPYDKMAETYYNVTPLDHYTEEEAESYLREYNFYTLQILNIHEAIPGHYTQLIYSNQSPSLIKSILGNGAMIEGWAVYAERMMMEHEYGGDALEMGLMYYKWNLRVVCNTILDYGIHVLDYTEEDAMHLLVKEAFQEQSEAKGKWRRARLSQVQLCSYFTGFYEIMKLREEVKQQRGESYNEKEFHEEFLSYGSAPVKYIRQLMLGINKASNNYSEEAKESI